MSQPDWCIRVARSDDREQLKSFSCADTTISWQLEVERFIQSNIFDWAFDPLAADNDPRLLMGIYQPTGDLFGIAAHERAVLRGGDGVTFNASKLELIALAHTWQARRFSAGERASDVLMSAVMTDIISRVPPRDARVFAIVHNDNVRSLRLCRRYGFTQEMTRPSPDYRRIVTPSRS